MECRASPPGLNYTSYFVVVQQTASLSPTYPNY